MAHKEIDIPKLIHEVPLIQLGVLIGAEIPDQTADMMRKALGIYAEAYKGFLELEVECLSSISNIFSQSGNSGGFSEEEGSLIVAIQNAESDITRSLRNPIETIGHHLKSVGAAGVVDQIEQAIKINLNLRRENKQP